MSQDTDFVQNIQKSCKLLVAQGFIYLFLGLTKSAKILEKNVETRKFQKVNGPIENHTVTYFQWHKFGICSFDYFERIESETKHGNYELKRIHRSCCPAPDVLSQGLMEQSP